MGGICCMRLFSRRHAPLQHFRQCNTCVDAIFGTMQHLRDCNTSVIANRRHCNTCVIATVIFQNFDPVSYKKPDSERENASLQHMRHCNVAFFKNFESFLADACVAMSQVLHRRKCCIDASVAMAQVLHKLKVRVTCANATDGPLYCNKKKSSKTTFQSR